MLDIRVQKNQIETLGYLKRMNGIGLQPKKDKKKKVKCLKTHDKFH